MVMQMLDPVASPGDPIFYLHHTWLDKLWWDWQKEDKKRLSEIGGPNVMSAAELAKFPPRPAGYP